MQLIEDWKKAWKMASVRVAVIIAILNAALAILPQLDLPPSAFATANAILGSLVVIARVVRQPGLSPETDPQDAPL